MTSTPQPLSAPDVSRATTAGGGDPTGSYADRLWIALTLARAGDTPNTLAHTEDAVFRFYLPMARTLARASARYPEDPEGAEQAAELGLAQAVLGWRHPSGQGFDQAATATIIDHLQQAAPGPPPASPAGTVRTHRGTTRREGRPAVPGHRTAAGGPPAQPVQACPTGAATVDTEFHGR